MITLSLRGAGLITGIVLWITGCICVLPAVWMLAGAFIFDGRPSLVHIATVFSDYQRFAELSARSAEVAAGSVVVALVFGVPAGFLCFRTNMFMKRVLVFACIMAACVPLYVTATCWMALFGMQFWLYSAWGSAWISGIAYAPLVALITGAAFAGSDRDLEEVAFLDAGTWGVLRHAILPAGAWGIGISALMVTILSLWDITVTDILMVRTFAEEVFTQFQLGAGPRRAAAISIPMILLLLALWFAVVRGVGARGEGAFWARLHPPRTLDLGAMKYPLALMAGLIVLVVFLAPVGAIVRAVGSPANLLTAWRTSQYEIAGTLTIVPVAATIAVMLAFPAAWVLARRRMLRRVVLAGLFLLISVPAPVVGIGLIEVLNRDGLAGAVYDSQAGLVLAYVIRSLPFAVLAILPAVKAVAIETEEAAMLDGADGFTRLSKVVFPECRRAILIAWFLAFIVAVTDMGASFLVAPPGHATLSTRFFTLIHYGVYPDAAGICLILMGIVGAAALVLAGIIWPGVKRTMA